MILGLTWSVHQFSMENHSTPASPKLSRSSSSSNSSLSSTSNGLVRGNQSQQLFRHRPGCAGQSKEGVSDKNKASQKPPTKERAKPVEIKLHTQQRAVKRAGFNYLIECKMTMIEHQRQQEEMFRRLIEEEDIRMLRKEMIPRAQLMPLFDKPFFPQRSTRPLTVPRDPSFHSFNSKLWRCKSPSESYSFQRFTHQSSKPIK